jgi:hypothetical protein
MASGGLTGHSCRRHRRLSPRILRGDRLPLGARVGPAGRGAISVYRSVDPAQSTNSAPARTMFEAHHCFGTAGLPPPTVQPAETTAPWPSGWRGYVLHPHPRVDLLGGRKLFRRSWTPVPEILDTRSDRSEKPPSLARNHCPASSESLSSLDWNGCPACPGFCTVRTSEVLVSDQRSWGRPPAEVRGHR